MWLLFRLVLLALAPWAVFKGREVLPPMNAWEYALIGAFSGAGIFVILMWRKDGADYSDPWSFRKPLYPMSRNPVRYWFFQTCCCLFGGGVVSASEIIQHGRRQPFALVVFSFGLGGAVGILLWKKIFRHQDAKPVLFPERRIMLGNFSLDKPTMRFLILGVLFFGITCAIFFKHQITLTVTINNSSNHYTWRENSREYWRCFAFTLISSICFLFYGLFRMLRAKTRN